MMKLVAVIAMTLMLSFSAKSQIVLSRAEAERALEIADSLDVCKEASAVYEKQIKRGQALDSVRTHQVTSLIIQVDSWQKAFNEERKATTEAKKSSASFEKMYNKEKSRGWLYKIGIPVGIIAGFLIAK